MIRILGNNPSFDIREVFSGEWRSSWKFIYRKIFPRYFHIYYIKSIPDSSSRIGLHIDFITALTYDIVSFKNYNVPLIRLSDKYFSEFRKFIYIDYDANNGTAIPNLVQTLKDTYKINTVNKIKIIDTDTNEFLTIN